MGVFIRYSLFSIHSHVPYSLLATPYILTFMKLLRSKEFWPWLVALSALFIRAIYVFWGTVYRTYVVNDMRWYWERALEFSQGDFFSMHQWGVWPPFYHMFVGVLIYLANFFVQIGHRIEVVLAVQIILASLSTYLVYRIALTVLRNEKWALVVQILYALAYPLIFLNSFVLSENVAIPLLILATWLVLEHASKSRRSALVLSAAALVFAIGMRPALTLLILPFIWYLGRKSWRRSALPFAITGGVIWLALVGYTAFISGGQAAGIGANGGVNFFLRQCRVRYLQVETDKINVVLTPTQFYGPLYQDLPNLKTSVPIYEQKFYAAAGLECLKKRSPGLIFQNILDLKWLFFGQVYFPWVPGALAFKQLISFWTWWFFGAILLALYGGLNRKARKSAAWPEIQFFLLLVAGVALTGIVFPVEPRFMYPLIFAIYILAALALKQLISRKKK